MKLKYLLIVMFLPLVSIIGQELTQTLLPLKQTGVEDFLQTYPEYDGRGTVVLIFDTGIDMGLDGLLKTTTDEVKVIDLQDFTGQGDIPFYEAEIDDEDDVYFFINEEKDYKINGADKLGLKAVNEEYFIGLVPEKLWMNSGSRARDVNGSGTEDDKFYYVTFLVDDGAEQYWVVYFDRNGDGDLSDETPLRNYKEKFDYVHIERTEGLPPFFMAVNIFPEKQVVNFYFDDGSHGTHCAGIAAGNKIGNAALNGVAPGAYLIGLKLGNNNFSGGATVTESMKKCFDYAAKIQDELNMPMIVNMSFGIGSEIEGHSDMEKYIDQFVKDNPYINICLSAGNSGPGISCSGLPSSSPSVISSGGLLTTEIAGDMYGVIYKKDVLYDFSARGGEVSKPDIITPGGCVSTVPNFARRDGFQGTSMASPHTAGLLSLLLSAAKQEYPDLKIPSLFVKKVLLESAVWMDDYLHIDQGSGIANIGNAWELLKKYIKNGELKRWESYTITSLAPNVPDNRAPNLYLRNSSFITGDETFTFNISRNNSIKQDKFYRIYTIKSDVDWLIPAQKKLHLRNNQSANVTIRFDKSKMTEPGLYNAKIKAYRQGSGNAFEFDMMASVVIPYQFSIENNYSMEWKEKYFDQGMYERYFIDIPPGATAMRVEISSVKGKYARLWADLYDPRGVSAQFMRGINTTDGTDKYVNYVRNLKPGVYELVVHSNRFAENGSTYNLKVSFSGIDRLRSKTLDVDNHKITIVNKFNKVGNYNISGEFLGYQKKSIVRAKGYDIIDIPFTLQKDEAFKRFDIMMDKVDYNKVTDFAVLILDKEGKAIATSGLNQHEGSITIRNSFDAESTELKLQLIPGFALASLEAEIFITEVTNFKTSGKMSLKYNNLDRVTLYPGIEEVLECEFEKCDSSVPQGSMPYGKIYLKNRTTDETEFETLVFFNF